jgi:hypothetical protein
VERRKKDMFGLHDDAASAGLLRSVGVVALVDLEAMCQNWQVVEGVLWLLTVPQRLGTMKSLGSLSVKAIRLRVACQHVCAVFWESSANSLHGSLGNGDSSAV